jgi:hypothetical protein
VAALLLAPATAKAGSAGAAMTCDIAINSIALKNKIPQGDPLWNTYNDSFEPMSLEPIELANYIYLGQGYAGWHNGRRKIENFIRSGFIAVDMDSGDKRSSFDSLLKHDFVRMYGSLMHTTPSHSDQSPRARVVFFLDEPITDAIGYQAAAKFLVAQFDGADVACTDASRFFYGSYNCDIWFSDNILPLQQLRHFYRHWGRSSSPQEKQTPQEKIIKLDYYRQERGSVNVDALLDPIRAAREGGRNSTLNRQAFLAGKDIAAGKLSESEIVPLLLSAAKSVGLDEQEAIHTINSGLRGGRKVAR